MGNKLNLFKREQPPVPPNHQHNNLFPSVNMRESQIINESFNINLLKKKKSIRFSEPLGKKENKGDVSEVIESEVGSSEREVPMRMPEMYNLIAEFINLKALEESRVKASQSSPPTPPQKIFINDCHSLLTWSQSLPSKQPSNVNVTDPIQFQFNPANDKLNTVIIAIIKYSQAFDRFILQEDRFNIVESQPTEKRKRYTTRLFINGQYRVVECLSRQNHWIKLLESAVHSIFLRSTSFHEYCYHLLRWIPISCDLSDGVQWEDGSLFSKVKRDYENGDLIAGVEIKGGLSFSVLEFIGSEEEKKGRYVVGRLGAYKDEIKEFVGSTPKQLQYRISKEKNIFVFDWSLLIKKRSTLLLASNPRCFPSKLTFQGSWTQPSLKTAFINETISLYYNPQYILRISPHHQQIKVKIVLSIHTTNFIQTTDNYPHISMFAYDGNRVVYLKDEISPNHQCTTNDIYTGIHIFSQSEISEYYSLVIFNSDKKNYAFTLEIYSESEVEMHQIPLLIKDPSCEIQGEFNQDNIGQNIFSPQFLNNPMYHLDINSPTSLQIFLESRERSFKVTNLIIEITTGIPIDCIRSFLSEYYQDFIKLYLSSGFYYPSIAYNRIKVTGASKYLYIPLGYQSEIPTDYSIRIITDKKNDIQVSQVKWKALGNTVSQIGLYEPDFVHKHPYWQEVFELTEEIIKSNRVYFFNFQHSIQATFKVISLTYERMYVFETQERIGDVFYEQPNIAVYICKVKKSDGRLLAKVHEKTSFSKCPSGLRTRAVEISEESDIQLWVVVVMVEYFENEPEMEYQLSINSNKKIEFGRLSVEKSRGYLK